MAASNRFTPFAVSVLATLFAAANAAQGRENLDGFWMDSDGEVILEVGPCGARRCAKVAWLKSPLGTDGQPLRDYRNSEPKLRSRFVCGLTIAKGFARQPDGTWGDGVVYVPDLGSSFSGYAEVLGATKVRITGYVLLPIFGESEVWTRVTAPFQHCSANAPSAAPSPKIDPPRPKLLREGRIRAAPRR